MSNHRKVLILVSIILVAIFLVNRFYMPISSLWYLFIMIPYTALLTYASLNLKYNFYLKSYTHQSTTEKKIVLTFDDGPDEIYTQSVLDVLKQHNVKATFFCIGKKIKASDSTLKRIDKEGHLIGNHSYRHDPYFDFFPPFLIKKDLQKTNDRIQNVIGKKPLFFRPPFGVTTPSMALALKALNMKTIGWDNRSFDTVKQSDKNILERIDRQLNPGGIILLHDILPKQATLLPQIIELIRNKSYKIVPLTELLNLPAYEYE